MTSIQQSRLYDTNATTEADILLKDGMEMLMY